MTDQSLINQAYHREAYLRSLDTYLVSNPSAEDYVITFDKRGPNYVKWIIPNKNKDVGFGKGNKEVPAYIMRLYRDHKGIEMVNELIHEDWEKRKKQYRDDERGIKEETMGLRSSDPKLWDQVVPQLVKGVVSRFGGDDIEEEPQEQDQPEKPGISAGEASMARLQLVDRDYDIDDAKDKFAESVK